MRWLNEHAHKKSLRGDKEVLRYLNQHLSDKWLDEITKSLVDNIKNHKLSTGVVNGTVNRVLALLRSILNAAKNEWEWIDAIPKIRILPEPVGRVRWLSIEESRQLIDELPSHIAAMARFALATGLRSANVTGLKWSNVDLQNRRAWIDASESKSGKAISIPLNNDAMAVVREQIGKHETRVFSYNGKPIVTANTKAFRAALKRAGIEDFCWHDLRHTWASWHIQNGTPIHVLKELGGWADLTMVLRYAHLSSEHLASYANNSNQVNDKILSYPKKSPVTQKSCKA